MTEIKKTLAILKARWPEVAFIIGIFFIGILTNRLLAAFGLKCILTIYSATLFVPLLFSLISLLLRLGFLRTVYLEGQKQQTLVVLLRTGIYFLWRIFVLALIYALPFILSTIVFSMLTPLYVIPWFYTLYSTLVNLILIKLIILIPALIIVLDCRVFDSFRLFRRYKLSNAKELVFLYCGNIAIGILEAILSRYLPGTSCGTTCCSVATAPQYILITVFSIAGYFISLMVAVMAVRFVASYDSVYNDHKAPLNSGGLHEH